jgi:hypothetical protein
MFSRQSPLFSSALTLTLAIGLGCANRSTISSVGGSGGDVTPGAGGSAGGSGSGSGGSGQTPDANFGFNIPDAGPNTNPPPSQTCDNLCLKQMKCSNGDTTVSGTVWAPTPPKFGQADPIYNALVYIPNRPVEAFKPGVACEMCGAPASGSPLVVALSGPDGKFVIKNAPVADGVPLVIQVGRWRRQVVIPKVNPCTDNPLPAELTRLPRNKAEGDIPLTAIATGNADALECVLRKIGVDEAEYTQPGGTGRIHLFKNNGAFIAPASPPGGQLSGSLDTLKRYDMAIFECEGQPMDKPPTDIQNLISYGNAGGRLFFTHFSYTWFRAAPFSGTATWDFADKRPTPDSKAPITGTIDQSFPKGMAFAQWLKLVGATAPMDGQIQINSPREDVLTAVPPTRQWITSEIAATPPPHRVQHFTFNTPVGTPEDQQCGRVLFSDFHVSDIANVSLAFPTECNDMPLTPQEKVLEFMLFDLASCVQPDSKPPIIP